MPTFVVSTDTEQARVESCDAETAAVGWVAAWWPFDSRKLARVTVDRVDDGVVTESCELEIDERGRARVVEAL